MVSRQNLSRAIIYLKHPMITAAFAVSVTYDGLRGMISGDVVSLAKFVEASEGVPRFDLEFNGRQFLRCVAAPESTKGVIPFSFESVIELDKPNSGSHTQ